METLILNYHKHMISISVLQLLVTFQPAYTLSGYIWDELTAASNIELADLLAVHTCAQPCGA